MVGGAPEFEGEMMDTRFKSAKVVLVKVRSELGAFAPPLRPPDPVGGTSGLHDGPLIGRTECLGETGQCGLDEPRLEGHPCGLAIGIKFLGHSQRAECRCDAPGHHNCADDDAGIALVCAGSFRDLLDYGQSCAGCGAITFKSAFAEVQ